MMVAQQMLSLIDNLPPVRGSLEENVSLARFTWFKVGGAAEVLFRPADTKDLSQFLKNMPKGTPITVMGTASNLLVRDGGIAGVVIRLAREFSMIKVDGLKIKAGSGAVDLNVARQARDAEITGFEFLSGIPGTIGGALCMNAGAYGTEIKDIFDYAIAVDLQGNIHRLSADEMGFSYRHANVPEGWIFVEGGFRGEKGDAHEITGRMDEIQKKRDQSQPIRTPTGGSTFRNPEGYKAWELIDQAGCRGLIYGGAMVSNQHCNFLINTGEASAADLESLGEQVRRRVMDNSGVELQWEIRRVGLPASNLNNGGTSQ